MFAGGDFDRDECRLTAEAYEEDGFAAVHPLDIEGMGHEMPCWFHEFQPTGGRRRMHVPEEDYRRIAESIQSEDSPVGIDAEKTHVIILHKLDQIESRLRRLEERIGESASP